MMLREEEPGYRDSGPNITFWISEPGGLTQFGAYVQVMPPLSRSSERHWHSAEDELVYILEGEVTLCEGDEEITLRPGDAATFKAGVPVGHYLENRGATEVRCFVVGTRAPVDRITHIERGIICHRDRSLPDDYYTDLDGNPVANPFSNPSRNGDAGGSTSNP